MIDRVGGAYSCKPVSGVCSSLLPGNGFASATTIVAAGAPSVPTGLVSTLLELEARDERSLPRCCECNRPGSGVRDDRAEPA
jgi:hypothetical protein